MNRLITALAITCFALGAQSADAQRAWGPVVDHASFCLKPGSANSRVDQKVGQGNCAAWLVGGALAGYLSGRSRVAASVLSQTEYGIGLLAAQLACEGNPDSNQVAIRLLTVCQCHNTDAQDKIDSNQTEAIEWLLDWSAQTGKTCPAARAY